MAEFKSVAKVGAIPEGQGRAFSVAGKMVAIFLRQGEYHAIDDFCPHMGASLAAGYLEDDAVSGKICEARNEVITGDKAVAEIRADSYPYGIKVEFVKENGEWKLTNKYPNIDAVKPGVIRPLTKPIHTRETLITGVNAHSRIERRKG